MAVNLRERRETSMSSEWRSKGTGTCPEKLKTRTWMGMKMKTEPKEVVPVIYYLSRQGQLEHPHFLEVPLSSPHGLFLRDVINRLNILRGEGLAKMYSWSSKRRYKNGFVWQDLSANDLIHPSQGHEYILKGSQLLLETSSSFRSYETSSSFSEYKISSETNTSITDSNFPVTVKGRTRNQSWNSIEGGISRDMVYKAITSGESGTNASTQTEERRRRRTETESEAAEECGGEAYSDSSFGRLESSRSMECNGLADLRDQTIGKSHRWKASKVLMQLTKCTFHN